MSKLQHTQKLATYRGTKKGKSIFKILIFIIALLGNRTVFSQQPNKIQITIDAIKAANYCEDQDYHTDGQRTVWVKSYKRWEPADLTVMKKEAPSTLRFLSMAAQRTRYDVWGSYCRTITVCMAVPKLLQTISYGYCHRTHHNRKNKLTSLPHPKRSPFSWNRTIPNITAARKPLQATSYEHAHHTHLNLINNRLLLS